MEHKKGHWIYVHPLQKNDPGAYMCSVCCHGDWGIKATDKICKFCGAEMECCIRDTRNCLTHFGKED